MRFAFRQSNSVRVGLSTLTCLIALFTFCAAAQAQSSNASENAKKVNSERLERFIEFRGKEIKESNKEAKKRARRLGLTLRKKHRDGRIIELQRFIKDRPLYYTTTNLNAARTVSSDDVWPGGSQGLSLTGFGQVLGIWDGGSARASHQELSPNVTVVDGAGISDHATHVSGTMISKGNSNANSQGMAEDATLLSFDWNNDEIEMALAQLLVDPVSISNHSYSYISGWYHNGSNWVWYGDTSISLVEDPIFGYYDASSKDWDQIVYDSPYYLITKSAGNDRNDGGTPGTHKHVGSNANQNDFHPADGGATGYDTIAGGSAAGKNVITVGAANDISSGYSVPADVTLASFSGYGPTDDGRIKPDIVGNGVSLTSSLGGSDSDYGVYSGTSMSSPNIAGSLALVREHANDLFGTPLLAATVKALMVHNADESGIAAGPDYRFGWGLMNTAATAGLMTATPSLNSSHIFELQLIDSDSVQFDVVSDGTLPFKVTMAWTDPAGTPVTYAVDPADLMLVNDLDIRVESPTPTTYSPWILDPSNPANAATTGDNFRDPIEQILIPSGVAGTYTITVTHKGTLRTGVQDFSLVVSGNDGVPIAPVINSVERDHGYVGIPYDYDDDNKILAFGTGPITYSLVSGPDGMTVGSDGLVTWAPTIFQQGLQAVQVSATNSEGSDAHDFNINIFPAPSGDTISFHDFVIAPYASQDGSGSVNVDHYGYSLQMSGNKWKSIELNYNLTSSTVIEFDFSSTSEGEIHGIGLDTDEGQSPSFVFKVYGVQDYGILNYDNYVGGGVTTHYVIPAGAVYGAGLRPYLFFIADDDASENAEAIFSNVRVHENVAPVNTAPAVNAGLDQTITLPDAVSLTGQEVDDGLPSGSVTTTWSDVTVSPPGTVSFGDANALVTTATFSADGVYTLRLTADDGALAGFDEVVVVVDSEAPTRPANLRTGVTMATAIELSWTESTDNINVVGYEIYRNGLLVGIVSGTTFTDTGLTADTIYGYQVLAYDASDNRSALSPALIALTTVQTGSTTKQKNQNHKNHGDPVPPGKIKKPKI